jgi:hypothetical protein
MNGYIIGELRTRRKVMEIMKKHEEMEKGEK